MNIIDLFGPAVQVTSIPNLCGKALPTLYEATKSAITVNALIIAMFAAIPLGMLAKMGYEYYRSRQKKMDEHAVKLMDAVNDDLDSEFDVLSSFSSGSTENSTSI